MVKINHRDSLFVVIIVVLFMVLLNTCQEVKRVESAWHSQQEEVKIWRDKAGRSNAELRVLKLDFKSFNTLHNNIVDSLRKLGIKPKTVTKLVTVTTETRDTVYISKDKPFGNRWAMFNIVDDKLSYLIRDSLALITYNKKYGFLNLKTKYVTRVISFNPNTILTGMTSTEIVPGQRKISIGFYAGYGMQLSEGVIRIGPSFGIGVTHRLF
jgi:hypothetical protein